MPTVADPVKIVRVTFCTGKPELIKVKKGLKLQLAPAGNPLQLMFTLPLKLFKPTTWNLTGTEFCPLTTVTGLGLGVVKTKSVTLSITGCEWVRLAGSIPVPVTLNV